MAISSPLDLGSDVSLWLKASDLSTLFQTITAGTPVTADGNVVGTWNDKSGDGFHLAALANDTTRPTYRTSGGISWVDFDGSNDILVRFNDIGAFAAGACSIFGAVRGNPALGGRLFTCGNTGTNTPFYAPYAADQTTASSAAVYARNNSGVAMHGDGDPVAIATGIWDNTDKVFGVVDTGTQFQAYVAGSATGTPCTITRSGTTTLNDTCLGALGRTSITNYFAGRVYEFVVVNRALNSTEITDLTNYLAQAYTAGGAAPRPRHQSVFFG